MCFRSLPNTRYEFSPCFSNRFPVGYTRMLPCHRHTRNTWTVKLWSHILMEHYTEGIKQKAVLCKGNKYVLYFSRVRWWRGRRNTYHCLLCVCMCVCVCVCVFCWVQWFTQMRRNAYDSIHVNCFSNLLDFNEKWNGLKKSPKIAHYRILWKRFGESERRSYVKFWSIWINISREGLFVSVISWNNTKTKDWRKPKQCKLKITEIQ